MANIDERVALIEGRVQEQAAQMMDFRPEIRTLCQEIGDLRSETRQAIGELRTEMRQLRDDMDRRFDAMERRFGWLVGMMVTGFLATIGTVAGAFWGVLQTVR